MPDAILNFCYEVQYLENDIFRILDDGLDQLSWSNTLKIAT